MFVSAPTENRTFPSFNINNNNVIANMDSLKIPPNNAATMYH